MKRGRPIGSVIRQRMVEILYLLQRAHGYELYKYYKEIHPPITLRVVYYHLRKGITLGEFKIETIEQEKGNYSWGESAEKIYYSLGPNAKPQLNDDVRNQLESLKAKFLSRKGIQIKKLEETRHMQEVLAAN